MVYVTQDEELGWSPITCEAMHANTCKCNVYALHCHYSWRSTREAHPISLSFNSTGFKPLSARSAHCHNRHHHQPAPRLLIGLVKPSGFRFGPFIWVSGKNSVIRDSTVTPSTESKRLVVFDGSCFGRQSGVGREGRRRLMGSAGNKRNGALMASQLFIRHKRTRGSV